MVVYSHRNPQM